MNFTWDAEGLPPEGRQAELEALVASDLAEMELERPEDLFFHTAFTGSSDGESVFVVPARDGVSFRLSYSEVTEWATLEGGES